MSIHGIAERRPALCTLAGLVLWTLVCVSSAAAQVRTAVEFGLTTVWDDGADFSYFVTWFPEEIAALDEGAIDGCCGYRWHRTGETFDIWSGPVDATNPACRFFASTFSSDGSRSLLNLDHFYTPYAEECASVQTGRQGQWQDEGIAFHVRLPDTDGACASGTDPLYRLYNNGIGGFPVHRLTARRETLRRMIDEDGWTFEGDGRTLVFACVPSSTSPSSR